MEPVDFFVCIIKSLVLDNAVVIYLKFISLIFIKFVNHWVLTISLLIIHCELLYSSSEQYIESHILFFKIGCVLLHIISAVFIFFL